MEEKKKQKPKEDLDWENRRLCVDEACIGVIGPDGRCKECGKSEDPETRPAQAAYPEDAAGDDTSEPAWEVEPEEEVAEWDAYWENRRLCVDEACIGVIGPDGRCKECGKPDSPATG